MEIKYCRNIDDIYCQYPNQNSAQKVFLWLYCKNEHATIGPDYEIGGSVSMDIWHNHIIRWEIPLITINAANKLLDDLKPRLEKIMAGYTSEWNGSNCVGKYTDEANDEIAEIHSICENISEPLLNICDAEDYFQYSPPCVDDNTNIDALACELEDEALKDNDVILYNTEDYLKKIIGL
jgi:hypothetical protein